MRYAHALIGGGVAGSRLAARLVAHGHGPVLVVDPVDHDPRTLALFVEPDGSWAEPFLMHRFERVSVRAHGRLVTRRPRRPYAMLRAQDLRDQARDAVEEAGGTVVRGRVVGVVDEADGGVLELEDGTVHQADWIYDSRLSPDDDATPLRQTFHGVWVLAEDPIFDPAEVLLMDFDRYVVKEPSPGVRFVHAMPTSPHRALVTAVAMGPGRPELPSNVWLPSLVPMGAHTIVATESGSTPLMTAPPVRWAGPRRLRIGNAGGLLKASTGYAVQRIDSDARAIVDAIDRTGGPALPRRSHGVPWRWLDQVFLNLVAQRGQRTASIFLAMFERRPIDAVTAFLDEQASCAEVAATVLRLPHWGWFAQAMLSRPLHLPSTLR